MNYEDMSFKEIYEMIKQKKLIDKDNNYIKQKPNEDDKRNFKTFVKKSGLTSAEAFVVLDYAMEQDGTGLQKKILKASMVDDL